MTSFISVEEEGRCNVEGCKKSSITVKLISLNGMRSLVEILNYLGFSLLNLMNGRLRYANRPY
jgi:hypothetical protein